MFKIDYGHAEATKIMGHDPREYQILSKEFVSDGNGNVKGVNTVKVEWARNEKGGWDMKEIPGSEKFWEADLILLSMGFLGPEVELIEQLALKQDIRSNISTSKGSYATSVPGVFAAGDCRRGASLIVWGINEGRQAAREIDMFLEGNTRLPVCGGIEERNMENLKDSKTGVAVFSSARG